MWLFDRIKEILKNKKKSKIYETQICEIKLMQ